MSATVVPNPVSASEPEIPRYRSILKKKIPAELFEPDLGALWWYPVHAGVIALCWFVLTNHFSWWTAPFLALAVGHSFGCMGFIAHDICHGGTIKNLVARDLLAGIGFSPFWISPRLWRRWHNGDHHTHTQVEGVDPDHLFTMTDYERNPILQWLYRLSPLLRNLVIFSSFSYRMNQQTLRMVFVYTKSKLPGTWEKVVIWSQMLLMLGLWGGVSYMLGSQVFWWGYFIPLLVANSMVIGYIATNHFLNPLADESDVLGTSLSVTLPKWLKWLDPWHQSFGAHVAHHLFPQASAKNCRKIESYIAEEFPDRFHIMPLFTALKMLWDTPWIYETKETFIDPVRDERTPTLGHGLEKRLKK